MSGKFGLAELAKVFTLPWSAYALLISVKDARGSVAGIPSSPKANFDARVTFRAGEFDLDSLSRWGK